MTSKEEVHETVKSTAWNPIRVLSEWGVRPGHAYTAGLVSVGISLTSWLMSRATNDSRAQSDRWGLFFGEWAPTFFGVGIALQLEKES